CTVSLLFHDPPTTDISALSLHDALPIYYLNRTGYNGLCRFNRLGRYNVPFGRYAAIRYVSDFTPYRDALAGWTFRAGDFADVPRSEEHTSELQSRENLVCRLPLEKKNAN